jgi:hypothetical protein
MLVRKYLIGITHRAYIASEVVAAPLNKQKFCRLILLIENIQCAYESLFSLHAKHYCRRSCRNISANILQPQDEASAEETVVRICMLPLFLLVTVEP